MVGRKEVYTLLFGMTRSDIKLKSDLWEKLDKELFVEQKENFLSGRNGKLIWLSNTYEDNKNVVSTTKRHFVCHDHSDDVLLIEIVFCFAAVFWSWWRSLLMKVNQIMFPCPFKGCSNRNIDKRDSNHSSTIRQGCSNCPNFSVSSRSWPTARTRKACALSTWPSSPARSQWWTWVKRNFFIVVLSFVLLDLNRKNFIIVVLSNKVSAVQSLVAAGADLGGTDKSGRSALHWAVACRQDQLVLGWLFDLFNFVELTFR